MNKEKGHFISTKKKKELRKYKFNASSTIYTA